MVEELGLDGETVRIAVSGFGRKSARDTLRKRISFTLAPVSDPGKPQGVEALTAPVICRPADAVDVYPTKWPHLQDIKFPEKFPRNEQEIDVLIGLDFYHSVVSRDVVRGVPNEPVALRTSLGWVFCGPAGGHGQDCTVSMSVQVCANQQLNNFRSSGTWRPLVLHLLKCQFAPAEVKVQS